MMMWHCYYHRKWDAYVCAFVWNVWRISIPDGSRSLMACIPDESGAVRLVNELNDAIENKDMEAFRGAMRAASVKYQDHVWV